MVKINPAMIVLAREYRGLTQEELARRLYVGQASIAKIEGGIQTGIQETTAEYLCDALDFPLDFFTQEEDLIGFGSSAYYYRKKAELSAADRKRIHGIVNLLRIHLKKFLGFVEIGAKRPLPKLDIGEDYGGSAAKAAQAVRAFWSLPDGPVNNLTGLIESAGVIVIPCDFGTRAMDATSLRLAEMPPIIFINKDVPGDRWRFTLAHELGHLVMHQIPHEMIEDEADTFAAELLMPHLEIKAQLSRYGRLRLIDLANLKTYWKASMGALIERAHNLHVIDDSQRRYLWMGMNKQGYRMNEPNPLPKEEPKNHRKIVTFFLEELKYSPEDFARMLRVNPPELGLHGVSSDGALGSKKPRLRVVQ